MEHILIKYYIIIYFERFFFVFFVETGAVLVMQYEIDGLRSSPLQQQGLSSNYIPCLSLYWVQAT